MTVKELIDLLDTFPQHYLVVMSKDAEGNAYSPFSSADDEHNYLPDSTWSGEVRLRGPLTRFLQSHGYHEEDVTEDGTPCVILCPVN